MEHLVSQVGVINAMRTGNMIFDMIIALSIPLVLQYMFKLWEWLRPRLENFFSEYYYGESRFLRTIEFEKMSHGMIEDISAEGQRNNILQKAIILYVGLIPIKYRKALVALSAVKERGWRDETFRMIYGSTAEQLKAYQVMVRPPYGAWVEVDDRVFFNQITSMEEEGPPDGGKQMRKSFKIKMSYSFKCNELDGDKRIDAFIQKAFQWYCQMMEATEDHGRYLYTLGPSSSSSPSNGGGTSAGLNGEGSGGGVRMYKRYRLSDGKDFSSLFFPEKEGLLKLLQHFEDKSGKYAIKGYPHKLGLLLHGPPGTGKTSMIKAIACHTGRNVVCVPLARIKTNQELMDIVFDQKFAVVGEQLPVSLGFQNVIFVMEDVDAASPIVHSRDRSKRKRGSKTTVEMTQKLTTPSFTPKPTELASPALGLTDLIAPSGGGLERPVPIQRSMSHPTSGARGRCEMVRKVTLLARRTTVETSGSSSTNGEDEESCQPSRHGKGHEENGDVPKPAAPSAGTRNVRGDKARSEDNDPEYRSEDEDIESDSETAFCGPVGPDADDEADAMIRALAKSIMDEDSDGSGGAKKKKKRNILSKYEEKDKLDLAGLLNVLDGVVDTPGRIVIMTTNHPEKLDAALIRPGRIDKKIYLGHMKYPAALEMTLHYFQMDRLTPAQDKRLRALFEEHPPAQKCVSAGGHRVVRTGDGGKFTPAVVEQLASEYETVDDFIGALQARV